MVLPNQRSRVYLLGGVALMEYGFFHPDRGYWQTTNQPSESVLATYPQGTVQVPIKPGADYELVDGAWQATDPAPEPKQPVSYWALRAALGPTRVAIVDAIIAGMDAGEIKTLISEKWAARTGFIQYEHPHTQAMLGALAGADPTLDEDAIWAQAEAYQNA